MPRTKLAAYGAELTKPQIPEPMYLKELFQRYARAYGMNFSDIGAALGCSAANVSILLNRPTAKWTILQINQFCEALHVPIAEAVAAAHLELR